MHTPLPRWVLCHEYRRSKRRCATVREMKEVLRGRQSGVDLKPPQAAVVKSNGGERCGNVGTGFRQERLREAGASEPLQKRRNRIRRCQNGSKRPLYSPTLNETTSYTYGMARPHSVHSCAASIFTVATTR